MKDTRDVTCCVVDRGTFFPICQRLARGMKKVYYHKPIGDSFEAFASGALGDGHDDIELVADFWRIKDEIDLFVFPDCVDGGLQVELESQGIPVWGSKMAGELETMRGKWIETCKKVGLPMPKTHTIRGLTNLRLFLDDHGNKDYFVKISRFRGDMETWEAKGKVHVLNKLDVLSTKFGPLKEEVVFYVQEKLETHIEGGVDTYFVGGQWPMRMVLGYEKKAQSYFATWKEREDMPPEIWEPTELVGPVLARLNYANFVSSEVRVDADKSYWLDPCFRMPSPAGEEELELYANFHDIVWHGANGILVEPEMAAKFCGEAVIEYCGDKESWKSITVPKEVQNFVKFYASIKDGDTFHFPPAQDAEAIGCAIGLGDKPEEVIDQLKEIREALSGEPVNLHIEELADLFKEIEEAEQKGIEFSDQEMPEPAEVIQ